MNDDVIKWLSFYLKKKNYDKILFRCAQIWDWRYDNIRKEAKLQALLNPAFC